MVTIQELQARQVRATQEGLDGHHVVIVKGLGSLTSHILYSLLFRLENVPGGATVILFEEDGIWVTVTDEDIQNGLYVPADRGKRHLDVLQDRYNGVFATEILAGNQNLLHTLGRGEDLGTNLFLLDFTKGGDTAVLQAFDAMSHARRVSRSLYTLCNLRAYTDNGVSHIHTRLLNQKGKVLGERYPAGVVSEGTTDTLFVRNQILATYIFNYINAMVSDGMTVDYHTMSGDMLQGEQGLTRVFFEPPVVTIFDTYGIVTDTVSQETLRTFQTKWETCAETVDGTVYPAFVQNYSNFTESLRYAAALRYVNKIYPLLDDPIFALETQRGVSTEFVLLLRKLKEEMAAKSLKTKKSKATGVTVSGTRDDLERHIKMGLTFIQYIKDEGVWML